MEQTNYEAIVAETFGARMDVPHAGNVSAATIVHALRAYADAAINGDAGAFNESIPSTWSAVVDDLARWIDGWVHSEDHATLITELTQQINDRIADEVDPRFGDDKPSNEPRPLHIGQTIVMNRIVQRVNGSVQVVELHDGYMVVRPYGTEEQRTAFYEDIDWAATNTLAAAS